MPMALSRSKLLYKVALILAILLGIINVTQIGGRLYAMGRNHLHKTLMQNISSFSCERTRYAEIYYDGPRPGYVDTVTNCIDFYAPLLYADFGLSDMPRVTIVLYHDIEALEKTLKLSYQTVPMGIYYGGMIHVLAPDQWMEEETSDSYAAERFVREGPLLHELTHWLTDIKTGGNYSTWFTEGVALYYEYKYAVFEWRSDLADSSRDITIDMLRKDFRALDEARAYRRAFDIIRAYVDHYGETALQSQMARLRQGGNAEDIFR